MTTRHMNRLSRALEKQWTAIDRIKKPLGADFTRVMLQAFPEWCLNVRSPDVVYLLKPNEMGFIKVGFTGDLTQRMQSYVTYYPTVPLILGLTPGGSMRESQLHDLLGFCRSRGEWFNIAIPDLKRALSSVSIAWNPDLDLSPYQKPKPQRPEQGSLF